MERSRNPISLENGTGEERRAAQNDYVGAQEMADLAVENGRESVRQQHSRVDLIDDVAEIKGGKKTKQSILTPVLLICVLAVIALVIAGAIVAGVLVSRNQSDGGSRKVSCGDTNTTLPPSTGGITRSVCRTAGCESLARLLLDNMDESVDPCEDFYNFSCGGWVENAVLPPGSNFHQQIGVLSENNTQELRMILENDTVGSAEVEAVLKVKQLYRLCMDTEAIDAAGAQPLLDLINRTGGWNLINGGRLEEWNINSTSFALEKLYSSGAFFTMRVTVDDKNSSRYIIKIDQGYLSLSGIHYILNDTAAIDSFKTYFVRVMSLLNSTVSNETYRAAADDIIQFEGRLVWIQTNPALLRDPVATYNNMTLGSLANLWPDFDWVSSFQYIFAHRNVTIDEDEQVVVIVPDYFSKLSALFRSTSPETLENYAKWQFISYYMEYLSRPFLDAYYEFEAGGEPERFRTCIQLAQRVFPIAIARPYIEHIFPTESLSRVTEMVGEIKEAFKKRLDKKDWLDDFTKGETLEKVNNVIAKVAYPAQLFNDDYLNDMTSNYIIYNDSFYQTVVEASFVSLSDFWGSLHEPVDTSRWPSSPTSPNAHYIRESNQIVLLAGILQPPVLGADWPDYYNYGAIGAVISHELTHGFDDRGQQYNKEGNLREWWSTSSVENFRERQKCFQDQYSSYKFYGNQVNGVLTLGENIADNGGLMTAYEAYRSFVEGKGRQPSLPGLKYSPDQIFFVAQAQFYCSIYNPATVAETMQTREHSPDPYRVIGPLSNSKEFSEVFRCSLGSPMNPPKKCVLW